MFRIRIIIQKIEKRFGSNSEGELMELDRRAC